MNELAKRLCLYGGAAAVVAALGWVVATHTAEADAVTMLSSADVQLRFAHGMPATDKQGRPLESRAAMIAEAERYLVTVDRVQPGLAVTAEFRGFAHMLRGQYAAAAAKYAEARQCSDCGDEQRDVLAFNEARMLAKAGQGERALEVFAQHAKRLDSRFGTQRRLEEAAILRQVGRAADAQARLDAVVGEASVSPVARLQAGIEYAALGRDDAAAAQLGAVAEEIPIADYHLAQLKLRRGDVDTCLDLLGRAAKAQPAEVRRLLREEAAAWSAVVEDARFQEITKSGPAAPAR
jgi:tetratricopeptide (TPR) repeat protein